MDITTFIKKATQKHGPLYNYDLVPPVVRHKDKVEIVCSTHGKFVQNVNSHIMRSGCPKCASTLNGRLKQKTREHYITIANTLHENKYNYSLVAAHPKATDKVKILCPTHGQFTQRLNDHVQGRGCNKCARESVGQANSKGLEHFLAKCMKLHAGKYDYTNLPPSVKIKDVVSITCHTHGEFQQVLDCHLAGSGCPDCAIHDHTSAPEHEIQQFLQSLDVEFIPNDRKTISPKELDILIPSYNVAIEYCGLYWHSEQRGKDKNYHKQKHDRCKEQGIHLITIFEDEWIYHQEQVKSKLLSVLGKDNRKRIFARVCNIVDVSIKTKQKFFEDNHIQGNGPGSINIGLEYNKELVACMSFIKHKNNKYYLNRYATNSQVIGGFSRLLKHFQNNNSWSKIISFADCRWSTGNLYDKTGWKLEGIIPPDYSYVRGNKRFHKFGYRRKHLPRLLDHFDPSLSERQNCDNNGILRIWDCGKKKFSITP